MMEFLKRAKPYLLVIFLQFGYAGSAIISKSALNKGMSHYAFSIYRNLIAAIVFAPFAAVLERKVRPRMTISVLLKIILLALLEPVIDQNLYYAAMKYTTATFATAMTNMLPALTFLLAWILRLEQVNIKSLYSQSKILGTLVTVGGATILTLVRGPTIPLPWTRPHDSGVTTSIVHSTNAEDPIKGAIMITIGCVCWASFHIIQAITLKSYPACLSLTSMVCATGALLSTILTLAAERGNPHIWSLHMNAVLLAYFYCGIVTSGGGYYASGIVMRAKGPVFVTAFSPLNMVIVAIMSTFFLREELQFGRVIGAITIVTGLYLVIWGKCKDQELSSKSKDPHQVPTIDQELPGKSLTGTDHSNDGKGDATKANNSGDNAV